MGGFDPFLDGWSEQATPAPLSVHLRCRKTLQTRVPIGAVRRSWQLRSQGSCENRRRGRKYCFVLKIAHFILETI
jgi:hypothetical protein